LPQLRIICLAHPAAWSYVARDLHTLEQKILALNPSSNIWLKLDAEKGKRRGIYKVEKLEGTNHIVLRFVAESEVKEDYKSLEQLLKEEGYLSMDVKTPTPVPLASKALLFLDLKQGVCYVFVPGRPPKIEFILEALCLLGRDTGIPSRNARLFEWKELHAVKIAEIARKEGFTPYKTRADLETVTITAVGDLEYNEKWKKVQRSLDLGEWKTLAYIKSTDKELIVFGLTKNRNKVISMPIMDRNISLKELLRMILKTRELIEKALNCDIRQYCFPEPIKPLSSFMR